MMKKTGSMSMWRFVMVGGALSTLPLALAWHLAHLQVIPGAEKGFLFLQSAGEARTLRKQEINAYRGVITDRNGELLAVSTPVKSIYANPKLIRQEQVADLADALGERHGDFVERLDRYRNKQFIYLARHLPPHKADEILKHRFSGVAAEIEYQRFYPAGEVTAHVVGFTGVDENGQEGVELSFNDWLSGAPGAKKIVKDLKGNVVKELGLLRAPEPGKDLQLTIDLRLQYLAYRELKSAIANQGAKSGSLVMMDAKTGEILAMVNQPSYNPNDRSSVKSFQLRNRAFTDVFEPGSTMKPFTVMAALESGKYSPSHEIDTSPGHFRIGRKTILDPVNYGVMDLSKIISKSSQVGISKLALEMNAEQIREMYFRMGFGQGTGVGFPGEGIGLLPSRAKWHPLEHVSLSFGYGLNVNAVQLAQSYCVIASGGEFNQASLIKSDLPAEGVRIVSSQVAAQVTQMLEKAVAPGGTAIKARIDAYPVAGKTGTAHKVGAQGYVDDKYMALFAGFAPANNPEIVAVVVINEPPSGGDYSGGKSAAPVFSSAVEEALRVLHVPPAVATTANSATSLSVVGRGM